MQRDDWDRVKDAFHAVREATGEERERVLDERLGENGALRAQVAALLEADEDSGSFLDSRQLEAGTAGLSSSVRGSPIEGPGDLIGPYKLLQQIGEGGFGVVYMAEQESPIRRRVALKVIKPGMDTKQVIARFEAERQALALMDHPNIARVFDAGTTPGGRPYFVMELVKGIPITDYCDDYELDTRERLELFVDVCRAVEHAHEAGVIHRDLKPSNVMVTLHGGVPMPKVIDFGVAKATRTRLTESTLFTEFHQFIGTPTYMSPEQAAYEGLDVDPRSDVYSLGVLLYELLTGTTPLDAVALKRAAYFEVVRILKEQEPPRPSTRVTTMGQGSDVHAKRRGVDPDGLARVLRGDLDSIIMKALEKDRRRRYGSASDMADDIARYFASKPIQARPASRIYRARKLVQRRRGRFAAAAVLLLAFAMDVGYVSWQRGQMADVTALATPIANHADLLFTSNEQPCFSDVRPSPDATRILYSNVCDDEPGLYVVDLGTGATERVTPEEQYYMGADWSPDGNRIIAGMEDGVDRRTQIIDLETGDLDVPPALADLSFNPFQWSPDGSHVSGSIRRADGNVTFAVVSLVSGEVTELAEGVRQGQASPAFSPDGRYVAFGDAVGDAEDLFVLDLESGERSSLTTTPEAEGVVLWSPDGSRVAYRDPIGLWAMEVSRGSSAGPARLVRRGEIIPNAWTVHGFYYTADNVLTNGYQIPVDPRDGHQTGAWEPLDLPTRDLRNVSFAWSPDMSRAVAAGWRDGMIHLIEGDRVTSFPVGLEVLPSNLWWSGDGTEVLYTSAARARRDRARNTVMVLDPSDGATHLLFPPTQGLGFAHVAPNGRSMVSFRSAGGRSRQSLVVSDVGVLEGTLASAAAESKQLASNFGQPLFDPSGERILYLTYGGEGRGLWVASADGSDDRKVAAASSIVAPKWDPTGRMIVFKAWDDGASTPALRVVEWRTGATHDIAGFSDLEDGWVMDWSPDGRWIAVSETIDRRELWKSPDLS